MHHRTRTEKIRSTVFSEINKWRSSFSYDCSGFLWNMYSNFKCIISLSVLRMQFKNFLLFDRFLHWNRRHEQFDRGFLINWCLKFCLSCFMLKWNCVDKRVFSLTNTFQVKNFSLKIFGTVCQKTGISYIVFVMLIS